MACHHCQMAVSATRSEAPGAARATSVVTPFGTRGPSTPLSAAPAKGSSGTSQSRLIASIWSTRSPAQQVEAVDVDGAAQAVDGDEEGEPDGRLRRRHRQHEEDDHLPRLVAEQPCIREDEQVDGVEHQLDG